MQGILYDNPCDVSRVRGRSRVAVHLGTDHRGVIKQRELGGQLVGPRNFGVDDKRPKQLVNPLPMLRNSKAGGMPWIRILRGGIDKRTAAETRRTAPLC